MRPSTGARPGGRCRRRVRHPGRRRPGPPQGGLSRPRDDVGLLGNILLASDMLASRDQRPLHLEAVVEHDHLRGRAHGQPTQVGAAHDPRRHRARRRQRGLELGSQRVQIAHGLDHGQRTARERPVGPAHHPALGRDLGSAQHVAPVAHAAAATASLTRAKRPGAACQATSTVSPAR